MCISDVLRAQRLEALSKLLIFDLFLGVFAHRSAVYIGIHEHPSTKTTTKLTKIRNLESLLF